MTLTTTEAAERYRAGEKVETTQAAADRLDMSDRTIRAWVDRGHLQPINPGMRPLLFFKDDIDNCHRLRDTPANRRRRHAQVQWGVVMGGGRVPLEVP